MAQQQMSEEQIKALQEKIKNMSPEELKEFQKKQCIFCQIIDGKVQSKKIYEDEHVVAVLDINPSNPGHMLIMPKEHYSIMPQIPEEEIEHLFLVVKSLSNSCLRALEVQGSNIIVANGVAAGQRAQHFMIHLIPRKEDDGIDFNLPQNTMDEKELENIRKMLAKSLGTKSQAVQRMPQIPIINRQENIVEAEFEEKPGKSTKYPLTEKPFKKGKIKIKKEKLKIKSQKSSLKEKPKHEDSKKSKSENKKEILQKKDKNNLNLDDIAKILGVK